VELLVMTNIRGGGRGEWNFDFTLSEKIYHTNRWKRSHIAYVVMAMLDGNLAFHIPYNL
jgi:hypothetical protein